MSEQYLIGFACGVGAAVLAYRITQYVASFRWFIISHAFNLWYENSKARVKKFIKAKKYNRALEKEDDEINGAFRF